MPEQWPPFVNDPLTEHAVGAGEWSLPSVPPGEEPAQLPPERHDYSQGIMVGPDTDLGIAGGSPHLLRERTDVPASYQAPHEATHRRYEPPVIVSFDQAAAGFTLLAAPDKGLHYVKLLQMVIGLDAAGTFKFVQGPSDGTGISAAAGGGDLSGQIHAGNAAEPPLVLPPADLANPWLYTAPDQALGIFTVTGKAAGWAVVAYSPYDS